MMYRVTPVKRLILLKDVDRWCQWEYPNHKRGCPNYGKNRRCPPLAPKIHEFFDLDHQMFLINSHFNVEEHAYKMKLKHPEWTKRQCRNLLYWQPQSRKELNQLIDINLLSLNCNAFTVCPEGMGVNVYATARVSGLRLEKIRNLKICRHVALLGRKKCSIKTSWS